MAHRKTPPKKPQVDDLERVVRSLQRRLKLLTAEHAALIEKHGRQLANAKRVADRRVTAMMREIATLRHLEARAEAMERWLTERDSVIAALRASLAAARGEPGMRFDTAS